MRLLFAREHGHSGAAAAAEGHHEQAPHQGLCGQARGHRRLRLALQGRLLVREGALRGRTDRQVRYLRSCPAHALVQLGSIPLGAIRRTHPAGPITAGPLACQQPHARRAGMSSSACSASGCCCTTASSRSSSSTATSCPRRSAPKWRARGALVTPALGLRATLAQRTNPGNLPTPQPLLTPAHCALQQPRLQPRARPAARGGGQRACRARPLCQGLGSHAADGPRPDRGAPPP